MKGQGVQGGCSRRSLCSHSCGAVLHSTRSAEFDEDIYCCTDVWAAGDILRIPVHDGLNADAAIPRELQSRVFQSFLYQ